MGPFFSSEDTGELLRLSAAFREVLYIFYEFSLLFARIL
jgi:hypothetical protein